MRTLVIFLGNILAGDDSIGYAVYEHFRDSNSIRYIFLGTDLFKLYGVYNNEEKLVIIDGIQGISTIVHLTNENLFSISDKSQHAHMLSAVDILKILKITMPIFPEDIHLVGVPVQSLKKITYDKQMIKKTVNIVQSITS